MSEFLNSKNHFVRGLIITVGFIYYGYYINIGAAFLSKYLPYNFGYIIIFLIPILIGLILRISGLYKFHFAIKKINQSSNLSEIKNTISFNDEDPYGIKKPIYEYKNELEEILKSIEEKHFTINDKLLVSLYINGLANVKERFWTTTYLNSGFWTHGRTDVINANKEMLNRLHSNNKKSIRRIFLLKNTLEDEIKQIGNKVSELKGQGIKGETSIKEMFDEFESLKNICSQFMDKGCEIKYYFDGTNHSSIGIINNKTEVALYDDFRVDYFDGGEDSEIKGIKTFHEKHNMFNTKKEEIIAYHESLWKKSIDIFKLFQELENALKYYSEKIDYTFPRLIKFDFDLNDDDRSLKSEELDIVKEYLIGMNQFDVIKDYLDIGTCTGRYPINLSKFLKNATILGIDADEDCVSFCNIQKVRFSNRPEMKNILFKKIDFLQDSLINNKFQLITCMLGTISHFGWNKKENYDDDLQLALKNMSSLLTNNGILIISNWTDFGLSGKILDIYNDHDRKRIKGFTEKTFILKKRLEIYFDILEIKRTTDNNLDILFCRIKS